MRKSALFFILLTFLTPAAGQLLQFGVTAGVPIDPGASFQDQSRRFVLGPSVELRMPWRFAVEFDALYRRIGYSSTFYSTIDPSTGVPLPNKGSYTNTYRLTANAWEFPLLGKVYLRDRKAAWAPYVSLGVSPQKQWVTSGYSTNDPNSRLYNGDIHLTTHTHAAGVGALGVRINAGRLAVLPEFRYSYAGRNSGYMPANQLSFLVGLRF